MSIVLQNVVKSFGVDHTVALAGISLNIEDGQFVSLTGRSGSGKSTLLYVMSSLDTPTTGTVEFSGTNLASMSQTDLHKLRNQKIGFVFQFHYLLPELTALENVLMPTIKTSRLKERTPIAEELLRQFDLPKKMHRRPSQLSGGEQQRVAIARSLIMDPEYLFADEPTGSLDSVNGISVMNILKEINEQRKTTIVLVTHEPEFAAYAMRRIHLADGKVVSDER